MASVTRSRCMNRAGGGSSAMTMRTRSVGHASSSMPGDACPTTIATATRGTGGEPYEFQDAHRLLSDFFKEVDEAMKEMLRP